MSPIPDSSVSTAWYYDDRQVLNYILINNFSWIVSSWSPTFFEKNGFESLKGVTTEDLDHFIPPSLTIAIDLCKALDSSSCCPGLGQQRCLHVAVP